MKYYRIKVDGQYFAGESEETEAADYGGTGNGFHHANHNSRNILKFCKSPESAHEIGGWMNLLSYFKRFYDRRIVFKTITIETIDHDNTKPCNNCGGSGVSVYPDDKSYKCHHCDGKGEAI